MVIELNLNKYLKKNKLTLDLWGGVYVVCHNGNGQHIFLLLLYIINDIHVL